MNICFHCLEEGEWEDEDKCPSCATVGHVSPWEVSKCPVCNAEYYAKMEELKKRMGITRPVCRQCKEKDERIVVLESVCRRVEAWWLTEGMNDEIGEPSCIFDLRALVNNWSTVADYHEKRCDAMVEFVRRNP